MKASIPLIVVLLVLAIGFTLIAQPKPLSGVINYVWQAPAAQAEQVHTDARSGTVEPIARRSKVILTENSAFSSTSPVICYAYVNVATPTAAQGIPFWNGNPLELDVDKDVVVKWLIEGATPSVVITQLGN